MKNVMKTIMSVAMFIWYMTALAIMFIDTLSYYKVMGEGTFQLMAREGNMDYKFSFMYLPVLIIGAIYYTKKLK